MLFAKFVFNDKFEAFPVRSFTYEVNVEGNARLYDQIAAVPEDFILAVEIDSNAHIYSLGLSST